MLMLYLLASIVLGFCALLVIYIFTRSSVPKKYPIFKVSDSIDDHYSYAISQLRTASMDSLSVYGTSNIQAFSQYIGSIKQKLEQLLTELDSFDAYWQHFTRFKAMASFVTTCRTYSEARRKQVASAQELADDMLAFMQATTLLRHVKQTAHHLYLFDTSPEAISRLTELQTLTATAVEAVQSLQPHHPATAQYRQYILSFLQDQVKQLADCRQAVEQGSTQVGHLYERYNDSWSQFNDSHTSDLINDEFNLQTDVYEQAMHDLRAQTDFDS